MVAEEVDFGCVVLLGVNTRTAELCAQQSSAAVSAAVTQASDIIPAVFEGWPARFVPHLFARFHVCPA